MGEKCKSAVHNTKQDHLISIKSMILCYFLATAEKNSQQTGQYSYMEGTNNYSSPVKPTRHNEGVYWRVASLHDAVNYLGGLISSQRFNHVYG